MNEEYVVIKKAVFLNWYAQLVKINEYMENALNKSKNIQENMEVDLENQKHEALYRFEGEVK